MSISTCSRSDIGTQRTIDWCTCRSVTPTFNLSLLLLFLPFSSRPAVAQARTVPTEGTPTIKSIKDSTLGCQSTVDNDVPDFWNLCYLYYLNEPLLVGRIRGISSCLVLR